MENQKPKMKMSDMFCNYIKLRKNLLQSKIYKLVDKTNDNIYIGSTWETLSMRLSKHKSHYNQYLKGNGGSVRSFDILKTQDYEIKLIEDYPCNTEKGSKQREGHYQDNIEYVNKNRAGRKEK